MEANARGLLRRGVGLLCVAGIGLVEAGVVAGVGLVEAGMSV